MRQSTDTWFRLFVFSAFLLVLADNIPAEVRMGLLLVGWCITCYLDGRVVDRAIQ